jgi:putative endonuclease
VVHYVYALRSVTDGGFYIGYSANLRERFKQHSQSNSFATAYRGPSKLFYYEAYLEQSDALGCEKYLKSGGGRRYLRPQRKELLQEASVERNRVSPAFTRIYRHVLNRPGISVQSPLDESS